MRTPHEATRLGDPRHYQIGVLSCLLAYGVLRVPIPLGALQAVATLGAALATQWIATRLVGLPRFDPRSALISGLSLCLLLRTDRPELAALAAVGAIASKFLLRARGRHLFNPTALALVVAITASDAVWVSPGQWGNVAWLALAVAGLGSLVTYRAERSDVTWAFLIAWSAVLFGRAAWLGDPMRIPVHQLQSGATLIFAFFMISDPRTTPDTRAGRILFAILVAAGAGWIEFGLWRDYGLLYALVAAAPSVPWIDRWLRPRSRRQPTVGPRRVLLPTAASLRETVS